MIWDVMDSSWQEVLEELKSYRNTYGNLDIKAKYVSPTGFRLGSWINNMRFKVKKYGIEQALTDEQRKELEELGMIWNHNKQKWEEYYSAAKAYYKEYGKGATRVLVHTKKGREIFNAIKDDFSYVEIAPEAAVAGAKEMKESVAPNEKRESFFKDANRMSGEELFNKYFPETFTLFP